MSEGGRVVGLVGLGLVLALAACDAGAVAPRGQTEPAPGAAAGGETAGANADTAEPAGTDEPTEEPTQEATEEPTEEPTPEAGTRENPIPIDTLVGNDDWDIQLGDPYEAWDEVRAENQFNDPPGDGMEFWILPVTVTYVGEETGDPFWDLDFGFVGDDSRTYDDDCGVIPDELYDVGEVYPDGEASANVCLEVPEGAPGLWTVAPRFGDPIFFTTEDG